jgi:excisionase family DNA binding protein
MGKKITLNKAAEELEISLRTVRRLISSGQLKAVKIGNGATNRAIRIDVDDLEAVCHAVTPNYEAS